MVEPHDEETDKGDDRERVSAELLAVKIVFGVIGLFVVLFIWGSIAGSGDDDLSDRGAMRACREAVEQKLESPGSAEFSKESATSTGDTSFEVYGVVDADNTFGASRRAGYKCDASSFDDGDTWTTSGVQIE